MMRSLIILTTILTLASPLAAKAPPIQDRVNLSGKKEPVDRLNPSVAKAAVPIDFKVLELWVDAGREKLAAYQVELRYDRKRMNIVGLEGGTSRAFHGAPYYDPKGMTGGRIIIAAFSPDDRLAPSGNTRVARLHLRVKGLGLPPHTLKLITAARPGGKRFKPQIKIVLPRGAKGE